MGIDMIELARIAKLEAALQEAMEFVDQYADVVDGEDGPEPNSAMSLLVYLREVTGFN